MHILVVNFQLDGITPEAYRAQSEQFAPIFAGLPGLISKIWLANPETNTYGGVYLWQDRAAMESYLRSEIVQQMQANPHFANLTVADFAILEAATTITRGIGEATGSLA